MYVDMYIYILMLVGTHVYIFSVYTCFSTLYCLTSLCVYWCMAKYENPPASISAMQSSGFQVKGLGFGGLGFQGFGV